MASETTLASRIDIELSLDPDVHSFSQTSPPILKLAITSRVKVPITIFTWNTPLDLPRALTNKCISIVDRQTGEPLQQTYIQIQRPALTRLRGSTDEKYFVTLQPDTTLEISCAFARAGNGDRPRPKSEDIVKQVKDRQRNFKEVRIPRLACGVDGLEPGREYVISLNNEVLGNMQWAAVDRENILVAEPGPGWYPSDYPWAKKPLEYQIKNATLKVEEE